MSKREQGLPGLPRKKGKSEATSEFASTQIVMSKPDTSNGTSKIISDNSKKEAPKVEPEKTDAVEEGEAKEKPAKPNLLKMSPAELKAHFKGNGKVEEPVDIETMVFIPKDPSVNLIPQEVLEGYRAHDLTVRFGKIIGTLMFVFLALFGVSLISSALNQQEITKLEEDAVALNLQIRELVPYETYKLTIDSKRSSLATQMQGDLDVAAILAGLDRVSDEAGITFETVSLDTSGTACTSPDPFNTVPTIGCVSFTGQGEGASSVVNFFESANAVEGFVNPYVPAAGAVANEEGGSTLEGSIGITDVFLSANYSDLNTPIDDLLAAEAEAAPAAETPETEETTNGE